MPIALRQLFAALSGGQVTTPVEAQSYPLGIEDFDVAFLQFIRSEEAWTFLRLHRVSRAEVLLGTWKPRP